MNQIQRININKNFYFLFLMEYIFTKKVGEKMMIIKVEVVMVIVVIC